MSKIYSDNNLQQYSFNSEGKRRMRWMTPTYKLNDFYQYIVDKGDSEDFQRLTQFLAKYNIVCNYNIIDENNKDENGNYKDNLMTFVELRDNQYQEISSQTVDRITEAFSVIQQRQLKALRN